MVQKAHSIKIMAEYSSKKRNFGDRQILEAFRIYL